MKVKLQPYLKHVFVYAGLDIFNLSGNEHTFAFLMKAKAKITQGLYSMTCYVCHGSIIVIKRSL